VSTYLYTVIAL